MNLIAGFIILIFLVLTGTLGVIVFKSVKAYENSENAENIGQESFHGTIEPIMLYSTSKNDYKSGVICARYYVTVSSPKTDASASIVLMQGKNVFGRSSNLSNFVIDDMNVSRIHFVIYLNKGQMIIEDCKSLNGTLLNGKKIGSTALCLNIGDEICAGKTRFIVGEITE